MICVGFIPVLLCVHFTLLFNSRILRSHKIVFLSGIMFICGHSFFSLLHSLFLLILFFIPFPKLICVSLARFIVPFFYLCYFVVVEIIIQLNHLYGIKLMNKIRKKVVMNMCAFSTFSMNWKILKYFTNYSIQFLWNSKQMKIMCFFSHEIIWKNCSTKLLRSILNDSSQGFIRIDLKFDWLPTVTSNFWLLFFNWRLPRKCNYTMDNGQRTTFSMSHNFNPYYASIQCNWFKMNELKMNNCSMYQLCLLMCVCVC